MTSVFAHSGSVSVVDTTTLRIVLIRSEYGSPLRADHAGKKESYVRRPMRTMSQLSSRSVWILSPSPEKPAFSGGHR
jgi:hypothetical protein